LKTKVVIIGSGNVATHLSLQMKNCGFEIVQVFSKNLENAKILADKLQTNYISKIDEINSNADIYIISISDSAIEKIVEKLASLRGKYDRSNLSSDEETKRLRHCVRNDEKIFIHTSGSISIEVLNKFQNYGVIYPLQTFSKNRKIEFENIPVFIEANNAKTIDIIEIIANKISTKVYKADSETRMILHISAVFANNFTNQMYSIAKQLVEEKNFDFDVLKPLISETTNKIFELSPENAQTGPANRNDKNLIKKHLEFLKDNPKLQKIYKFVSESIFETQKKKLNG
jgi:predicted short-subunit dehydrogenase-like oxidoreductase (DUF2520 family)